MGLISGLKKSLRGIRNAIFTEQRASTPRKKRFYEHVYSIGIYAGKSPWKIKPKTRRLNPVLTRDDVHDTDAISVADPFMLNVDGIWHMFFEVHDRKDGKGKISLAVSRDLRRWQYQRIVLEEPFHLSYPYVFEWKGDFYMVPESYEANAIRLYRASRFPGEWTFVRNIVGGVDYVDSSVIFHDGLWWLFSGDGSPPLRADHLRLFYAKDLLGEWIEHPKSPVVRDNRRLARPAGRIIMTDKCLVRYTQDCSAAYGIQVFAVKIDELSTHSYHEIEMSKLGPVLLPSGKGWNRNGMHHIDIHWINEKRFVACVDGWNVRERPEWGY